jgi:hypothetical protein
VNTSSWLKLWKVPSAFSLHLSSFFHFMHWMHLRFTIELCTYVFPTCWSEMEKEWKEVENSFFF